MGESIIENVLIYFTKALVGITFLMTIGLLYKSGKKIQRLLILILFVSLENELFALIFNANGISTGLLYTVSTIFHHALWLILISSYGNNGVYYKSCLAFLAFALLNLLFYERLEFNFYTFIFGSLLYIMILINKCFQNLKKENLSFFLNNDFLLLIAPVLFFFGFSFIFAFGSIPFVSTDIFRNIRLYDLIQSFVNIIYYVLSLFILSAKKTK